MEINGQAASTKPSLLQRITNRFDSPTARAKDQLAFLPAALEIQETPPSPIGRAIIWTIAVLFIIAVVWATVGKIDIVAVAKGKIIPSDRVKVVQPLEIGTVKAIHIKEGQQVSAGQPLITLDGTNAAADVNRLQQELAVQKLELLRHEVFQVLLEEGEDGTNEITPLIHKSASELNLTLSEQEKEFQARLLKQQLREYQARKDSMASSHNARQAEQQVSQELKIKLQKTLPIITQRAESLATLLEKNLVARDQYLELEQLRIEQQQDLRAQKAKVQELAQEIEEINNQLATTHAEYQRNNLLELQQVRGNVAVTEQELIKAAQRNSQQILYAPISGTVQQLAVHTIGGVVTPAQQLLLLVPEQSQLEVEAFIANNDIGFVSEGQIAEVKIDTFNFTQYGLIDAEIVSISEDAVSDEHLGLIYPARVVLKQAAIKVADKWVNLGPGMTVTVEIKTGKRRLIEFFLSPLLRYQHDSIRER